uniref:Uncharacterized protein n=1 Tax=Arundo donax TaxID=35708 RepID=A0A0A9HHS5_ARUDO
MVLAPAVKIHGATLETVPRRGPELPAEQTTVMPQRTAWKDPMAMPSLK